MIFNVRTKDSKKKRRDVNTFGFSDSS